MIVKEKNCKRNIFIQIILILFAFGELLKSDAYYMPYLLIAVASLLSLYYNFRAKIGVLDIFDKKKKFLIIFFSMLYSAMISLSNYTIWNVSGFKEIFLAVTITVGSGIAILNILLWLSNVDIVARVNYNESILNSVPAFWITLVLISGIDLFVLLTCKYPGILSSDNIDQMYQIFGINELSNHHPFYHTMTIKFFVSIGMRIYKDLNAAISLYFVFQILFMAFCFAYSIKTCCEIMLSRRVTIIMIIFYTFMPFHFMYAITMWKDVIFGGFVLLFTVILFRCVNGMGKQFSNYVLLTVSGMGVCLFRSNGLFAFIITTIGFVLIYKKKYKKEIIIMAGIIVMSTIMKYPVLNAFGVKQPMLKESLSIPLQQIARVIRDDNDLTDSEIELLEKVIDVDKMGNVYETYISDPVKNLLRERGNQDYIIKHKFEYIKLYVNIGLRHPVLYVQSWIDETKGYWNSGYEYWRWYNWIDSNNLGIARTTYFNLINKKVDRYLSWFTEMPLLQTLVSIGVYTWILIGCLFNNIIKRNRGGITSTLLSLSVILSLIISTPVYSEFRYAYSSFCTVPVLVAIMLCPSTKN